MRPANTASADRVQVNVNEQWLEAMSLETPIKIRMLQRKLYQKAK